MSTCQILHRLFLAESLTGECVSRRRPGDRKCISRPAGAGFPCETRSIHSSVARGWLELRRKLAPLAPMLVRQSMLRVPHWLVALVFVPSRAPSDRFGAMVWTTIAPDGPPLGGHTVGHAHSWGCPPRFRGFHGVPHPCRESGSGGGRQETVPPSSRPTLPRRAQREAEILNRLAHPNIVKLTDCFRDARARGSCMLARGACPKGP